MRLRVKDDAGNVVYVKVGAWAQVKRLKEVLAATLTIPAQQQRLFCKGRELRSNDGLLRDYNVDDGSHIRLRFLTKEKNSGSGADMVSVYGGIPIPKRLGRVLLQARQGLASGIKPKLAEDGLGGTYFVRNVNNKIVGVFKPGDEEPFAPYNPKGYYGKLGGNTARKGIRSGEGHIGEVAAYLLDHGGFSGVPATSLVEMPPPLLSGASTGLLTKSRPHVMQIPVERKVALQKQKESGERERPSFVPESKAERSYLLENDMKIGSFQEFVASYDVVANVSYQMFSVEEVHKICLLDLRIVNTDRNEENLLVARTPISYEGLRSQYRRNRHHNSPQRRRVHRIRNRGDSDARAPPQFQTRLSGKNLRSSTADQRSDIRAFSDSEGLGSAGSMTGISSDSDDRMSERFLEEASDFSSDPEAGTERKQVRFEAPSEALGDSPPRSSTSGSPPVLAPQGFSFGAGSSFLKSEMGSPAFDSGEEERGGPPLLSIPPPKIDHNVVSPPESVGSGKSALSAILNRQQQADPVAQVRSPPQTSPNAWPTLNRNFSTQSLEDGDDEGSDDTTVSHALFAAPSKPSPMRSPLPVTKSTSIPIPIKGAKKEDSVEKRTSPLVSARSYIPPHLRKNANSGGLINRPRSVTNRSGAYVPPFLRKNSPVQKAAPPPSDSSDSSEEERASQPKLGGRRRAQTTWTKSAAKSAVSTRRNSTTTTKPRYQYTLIPIDHSYAFPDTLEVDSLHLVWYEWPQAKQPLSEKVKAYISNIDIDRDCQLLAKSVALRKPCLKIMKISQTLLKRGAAKDLTFFDMANILCRQDEEKPSILELLCFQAQTMAHRHMAPFTKSSAGIVARWQASYILRKQYEAQLMRRKREAGGHQVIRRPKLSGRDSLSSVPDILSPDELQTSSGGQGRLVGGSRMPESCDDSEGIGSKASSDAKDPCDSEPPSTPPQAPPELKTGFGMLSPSHATSPMRDARSGTLHPPSSQSVSPFQPRRKGKGGLEKGEPSGPPHLGRSLSYSTDLDATRIPRGGFGGNDLENSPRKHNWLEVSAPTTLPGDGDGSEGEDGESIGKIPDRPVNKLSRAQSIRTYNPSSANSRRMPLSPEPPTTQSRSAQPSWLTVENVFFLCLERLIDLVCDAKVASRRAKLLEEESQRDQQNTQRKKHLGLLGSMWTVGGMDMVQNYFK